MLRADRIFVVFVRTTFLPVLLVLFTSPAGFSQGPEPGDLFCEYVYPHRFSPLDPAASNPGAIAMRGARVPEKYERLLDIAAVRGAIRAELAIEYWGGHIGTTGQKFRVNGNQWIDLPQPRNTPTAPQCYYRTLLGAAVPIPPASLKPGSNTFEFAAGPQSCYNFNWGFYWIYAFTVRLYYAPKPDSLAGRIVSPAPGASIDDYPKLTAEAHGSHASIARVDFVAEYEDFNWRGDGVYRAWQYQTARGRLRRHIGTADREPWSATWDTTWVPDQDQPVRIVAWITDTAGDTRVTEAVAVKLARRGRSVRMYKPYDVPEAFGVRTGARKICKIDITDDPATARGARLALSTWSAAHASEIGLNDAVLVKTVGPVHNYSHDLLPVPPGMLRKGTNVFHVYATTREHAAEINWPGPVLLLEFRRPTTVAQAPTSRWRDGQSRLRLPVSVAASGYRRTHKPAELEVNFTQMLRAAGVKGAFNEKSLRMVELDSAGEVADPRVAFQFDRDSNYHPTFNARGRLVFLLKGETPPDATRHFHLYFGGRPNRLAPDLGLPPLNVVDNIDYQGQKSLRIETPAGVHYYHKEGAGFARIEDRDGNDWIGYRPGGRSAGEFRGIPNSGEFAHPGYSGSRGADTVVLSRGLLKVSILSERHDKRWAAVWEIYPRYARMTMLRNPGPYWFLYEGTPGGSLSPADGYQVFSTGERRPLFTEWDGDLPAPEWLYFGHPKVNRVLYLVNHEDDDAPDQYWPMEGNMTVFGFGRRRGSLEKFLTRAPASFTVGFAESTDFAEVSGIIDSAYRELKVIPGAPEKRPGS